MSTVQLPKWFKAVVALALVWNLVGIFQFLHTNHLNGRGYCCPSISRTRTHEHHSFVVPNRFRHWGFGGSLGCIGLFVQKMVFLPFAFFFDSRNGANRLLALFHQSGRSHGNSTYGMPMVVILVAYLLFRLSKKGIDKGYLR